VKGLNAKPVRIEADDDSGEWIEIKAALSRGDRDKLSDAMMAIEFKGGDAQSTLKTLSRETLLLELAITGWSLLGEDGQPWAYKPARVAELPLDAPLVDKVLGEIADRNPTLSATAETNGSET